MFDFVFYFTMSKGMNNEGQVRLDLIPFLKQENFSSRGNARGLSFNFNF